MNFKAIAQEVATVGCYGKFGRALEVLGDGSYGAAYLHKPSGLVLKVSFSKADGTMGVIARCAKYFAKYRKAPRHCPEIYEFGVLSNCWYAVMEYVHVGEFGPDLAGTRLGEALDAMREAAIAAAGGVSNLTYRVGQGAYSKADSSEQVDTDLHSGNYGRTKDGRTVVFDPLSAYTRVRNYPRRVQMRKQYGPSQGRWA